MSTAALELTWCWQLPSLYVAQPTSDCLALGTGDLGFWYFPNSTGTVRRYETSGPLVSPLLIEKRAQAHYATFVLCLNHPVAFIEHDGNAQIFADVTMEFLTKLGKKQLD